MNSWATLSVDQIVDKFLEIGRPLLSIGVLSDLLGNPLFGKVSEHGAKAMACRKKNYECHDVDRCERFCGVAYQIQG